MTGRWIIYFMIMGVIGYIYECTAMTLWLGRWDNRGSLYGPMIPIYGAGALLGTLVFSYYLTDHTPLIVFLAGMCCSAMLEYPVHWLIEKYLHTSYWDYSRSPLNLHGRICLPAAVGFGVGAVVIVYGINRVLVPWIMVIPQNTVNVLASVLVCLMVCDILLSLHGLRYEDSRMNRMEERIDQGMQEIVSKFINESQSFDRYFFAVTDRIGAFFKK